MTSSATSTLPSTRAACEADYAARMRTAGWVQAGEVRARGSAAIDDLLYEPHRDLQLPDYARVKDWCGEATLNDLRSWIEDVLDTALAATPLAPTPAAPATGLQRYRKLDDEDAGADFDLIGAMVPHGEGEWVRFADLLPPAAPAGLVASAQETTPVAASESPSVSDNVVSADAIRAEIAWHRSKIEGFRACMADTTDATVVTTLGILMVEHDTSAARLSALLQRASAKNHAVALEQCSLFVDSEPLAKAMTDAAAFLRALVTPPAENGEG